MRVFFFLAAAIGLWIICKVAEIHLFLKMAIGRPRVHRNKNRNGQKSDYETAYEAGIEWLEMQEQEVIKRKSYDGLSLIAHFIPAKNQKRILLAFHGWHSSWKKDFALCARDFLEKGCSLLLVEQRAQGNSEGDYMGFGILERYDCHMWTHYISKRFGEEIPVYLYGVSMGAATVLMACGQELPVNVRGIIADCGFTTPYDMVAEYAKKFMKMREFPSVPRVNRLCLSKAGYDLKGYSTLEAMKVCKIPVFFIHGTEDDFVPYHMTLQNYQQCAARKELMLVEGAGHCRCYFTDRASYMEKIEDFFGWNFK